MRLFSCGGCGQILYFHNVQCTRCGRLLGFDPDSLTLLAFEAAGGDGWEQVGGRAPGSRYRRCDNYRRYGACNWMIPDSDTSPLCRGCQFNRTIPDLGVHRNLILWQRVQSEKNRLLYSLLRMRLPLLSKTADPAGGLAFEFLADPNPTYRGESQVVTGHDRGVITIDVAEADDAFRERMRQQLGESYRTLLGHFRHEAGHYYWDRLVRNGPWLGAFRELFGDETRNYGQALNSYYGRGASANWQRSFVSAYASSHPWEDWAESWAHYLHIVDTLETAWQFGLRVHPEHGAMAVSGTEPGFDPYADGNFQDLIDHWLPLTYALNSLNQSMGQTDAYPFLLAPAVLQKLELVHRIARSAPAPGVSG